MFDISSLTLGEVSRVEELSGQSITAFGDDNAPKGKALAALAYVAKRRQDLTFKWEDALELTMDEANKALGMDADEVTPDPTIAP